MKQVQDFLSSFPYLSSVYLTFFLILLYHLARYLITKKVDKSEFVSNEDKVLAKKRVRDYGRLILILTVFSLWFSQLQNVFVSLLVFASAIVLAFKEVIMCITGGMVVKINKQFSSGDRIEIDGIRGFVIEKSITAVRLLELGPEKNSQQTTGNIITIPNSLFLSKAAVNQSSFENYSIRSFTLSLLPGAEFEETESILLNIANSISADYLDQARDSILSFCRREGILIPTVEPRVKLLLSQNNDVKLLLKMPVDNKKIGDIEQILYREYYNRVVIYKNNLMLNEKQTEKNTK